MNWSTTDGRSWCITVGDNQAVVWLIDEVFYRAAISWSDKSSTLLEEFECIKKAKQACLDEIERLRGEHDLPDGYEIEALGLTQGMGW